MAVRGGHPKIEAARQENEGMGAHAAVAHAGVGLGSLGNGALMSLPTCHDCRHRITRRRSMLHRNQGQNIAGILLFRGRNIHVWQHVDLAGIQSHLDAPVGGASGMEKLR